MVVRGAGFALNDEMDDFATVPGQPNAFGVVGADANAVASGKRPLSSMSPTILLKDNLPYAFNGKAYLPDEPVQAIARGLYRLILLQQTRKGK